MPQIENAIIMAAGIGQRMRPLSKITPKPLISVNGIQMIESVIQALRLNGIFEIYVVVGYLKEQFCFLESHYSGLKLVENPHYNTCNNMIESPKVFIDGDSYK